jgi:signal transduction histidine kinase
MENLLRKLGKVVKARIDTTSLQFRLSFGVILILTLGIGSLSLWMGWELKQLLIIFNHDIRLLAAIQHLKTMSILSIATTATLTTWWLWRSLFPWRQNWNRLLARLSETREQQRQFTNDLAHELRTPLSMVYGYLQRTQQRSENLTDSQKEALAMAVEEAERMIQLLQDWLELARSDNSVIALHKESLLLNDLVREVAEMTEKFEHRHIERQISASPIPIQADRNQLMQVLSHLLENAIQYSDESEPVTVQLTQSEDWAVIQVSDRGCGIPLSQQSRIFDPFYRVDPSRTRATGGPGLGLSLVKRLVESMGGKITVQFKPGEGSNFILTLPILGAKP